MDMPQISLKQRQHYHQRGDGAVYGVLIALRQFAFAATGLSYRHLALLLPAL
jgi:hypothetical protein